MRIASADDVRAAIAAHVLGVADDSFVLGGVTLHPHQREGLNRIKLLLERHRGALLADEVGLGKTFVALAVARDTQTAVVVAPAAIRDTWMTASRRAGVPVTFVSVETLSQRGCANPSADLVIVDEAHHLRSASTRRFAAASAMCRRAKVLLMTATPVQNSERDLRVILSLFLGESAHALPVDELARYVVRRGSGDVEPSAMGALPRVEVPQWIEPIADVDCLDRLLALPRAVPPLDGDDGGVLLTYTLVRQWSSSRAALRAALQRRLARGLAMEDILMTGRMPARDELTAWSFADGVQQLAFPELTATATIPDGIPLLTQVQRHCVSVRALIAWLDDSPDPDRSRADALRELMRRKRGERLVAFSEYSDTVSALYRVLAPAGRVAMLTASGGRVASGRLSRREVLDRFGPGSAARTRENERIDLLITTDVLSEGVNLQDASVVVHLDLAWNPARMEQRVGRLRRLGARRDTVAVYVFSPPAPAERLLRLEQRLRVKLGAAARAVGVAGSILPGIVLERKDASAVREERIAGVLRRWRRPRAVDAHLAGGAASSRNGALACVRAAGQVSLVAVIDGRVIESRSLVEQLVECAAGPDLPLEGSELSRVRETVERWLRHRGSTAIVDLSELRVANSRRALLHRVDVISRRAPRHVQPQLAPLMRAARTVATAQLSAGAERVLDELAAGLMSDTAWLHAVGEFAALHAREPTEASPQVLGLLVLKQPTT